MNQYDIAGVLTTYSKKCFQARDTEHLRELVRRLKEEFNSKEIRKIRVEK